jgi:hypothetical protein
MREATHADFDAIVGWIARDSGLAASAAMRQFLNEPANLCLIEGEGGALFIWRGPGIYECHVMFAQRGREVIELSHQMLAYMRDTYGARTFWASVPWDTSKQSRKVRLFTRLLGWQSRGRVNFAHGLCEVFISE